MYFDQLNLHWQQSYYVSEPDESDIDARCRQTPEGQIDVRVEKVIYLEVYNDIRA